MVRREKPEEKRELREKPRKKPREKREELSGEDNLFIFIKEKCQMGWTIPGFTALGI